MSAQATKETSDSSRQEYANSVQYLTFYLNNQEYGIEITRVQAIQGWQPVTAIPNSPNEILGVINLRGSIVPIMDLRIKFQMPNINYDDVTVVIIVKVTTANGEKVVGFVVDAVSEVYNVSDDQMNPSPEFGSAAETEYVKGLASIEGSMVIALDVEKLVVRGIVE